jgi:hypothetical protein
MLFYREIWTYLVRSFVRILCTHAKRSAYVVVYLEISITKSISLVGLIFERALFGTGTLIKFVYNTKSILVAQNFLNAVADTVDPF